MAAAAEASMCAIPDALLRDPPPDPTAPAQSLAQAIPSGGVNLNAVLYTASGQGPHPTILLLHGLPGNEQNIDLAQSARRAGWNVLTLHYRGSWGSPGSFSFDHCLEDGAAALAWLRARASGPRIDRDRIAVVGHSMGGFVAAHLAAADPGLIGAGLLSGVALGPVFGAADKDRAVAVVDENVGTSEGLHILSGTSPGRLADEAGARSDQWRLETFAPALAGRPLLLVTSDDGFAPGSDALARAVARCGGGKLRQAHFPTDHSYSDHRIALQTEVLTWLHLCDPPAA
ncbi:alpha/beta hydrolase family protein [Sphingomonas crusticola]|uniref:alpha/beta hydrolase family protein n=1 Tax=Sphingomonas crusticola TaxID=1697973 RepID=UPI001F080DBF|nr:alpha/beta fold hydrolase [Sphingomonas crusticola]